MTASSQPELAIIIPIYGHPSLLIDAIESALRQQTTHDYRIVLVNDGCPSPQTDQVCRQYAQTHPERILYIQKRNGGLSAARNSGIQIALTAWPSLRAIYLLDADNRLHPHLLERGYALLQADPRADWLFPDVHMFGSSRQFCDTTGDFSALQILAWNYCEAGSMVRREVFEAGIFFDESMKLGFEDWEFWLQCVAAGFKGRHFPAAGFLYRKRPESMLANSYRDQPQIIGAIRRKHAKLYTPRTAKKFEQEEMPRCAVYLAERDELIVTSDLNDLSQRQTWPAFTRALRRNRVCPQLQGVPPIVVVTTEAALQLLKQCGVAANVFWLLEADLEEHPLFFLTIEQRMGVDIRLELSKAFAPGLAERRHSVLCALRTSVLAECLADPAPRLLTAILQEHGERQLVGRRLELERLERPTPLPTDAVDWLRTTVDRLRPAFCAVPGVPLNPRGLFFRSASDAGRISQQLFQGPAAPPIHLGDNERHIGFVVPIAEFGGVERVVCNLAREARRNGWHVHLFVVGSGRAILLAEFKEVFESIHLVPDERLTKPERLVSLLGTMDVVLSHHTVPLNDALEKLKRLGVKLINHLHLVDLTGHGMPCGHPYLAVEYEHSVHKIAVISDNLRNWMLAKGMPSEKILFVPNAPSFEVPPERVEAALLERSQRRPEQPLRVLFMARFDQQKGLDRLVDLVQESTRLGPTIEWRIVGKSVLQESGRYNNLNLSLLEHHLHLPAFDVHSLIRHYCWADVLILVSRYEGVPLTILEAQQLGCVPIATNCGAVSELIADGVTGFLLENTSDTKALTNQVLELFTKLREDRARLVELARQAAEVFRERTWRHTTRELMSCLEGWCPQQQAA